MLHERAALARKVVPRDGGASKHDGGAREGGGVKGADPKGRDVGVDADVQARAEDEEGGEQRRRHREPERVQLDGRLKARGSGIQRGRSNGRGRSRSGCGRARLGVDRLKDGDLVDAPEAAEVALVPQHDQLARAGEEAAEVADPSQLEVVIRLVDAQAVDEVAAAREERRRGREAEQREQVCGEELVRGGDLRQQEERREGGLHDEVAG